MRAVSARACLPAQGRQTRQRRAVTRVHAALTGGGGGGGGGPDGGSTGSGGGGGDDVSRGLPRALLALGAAVLSSALARPAHAAKKAEPSRPAPPPAWLSSFDVAQAAGLSAAVGFGSGLLCKTLASASLIVLAATVAFLKWLELHRLITIHWQEVVKCWDAQVVRRLMGKDGRVDAGTVYERCQRWLATSIPSAGGFAAGFALGIKP